MDAQSVMVVLGSNRDRVANIVNRLDRVLEQNGFQGEAVLIENGKTWNLGTYDLRFNHRVIHNGFLEPVFRRPIVEHLSERVVAYLITLDEDDSLLRERGGGVGWHYHYLNRKEERSDVVLAWDTRAEVDHKNRGIFSEKHAERDKAFSARPAGWKDLKRQTIHTACRLDLKKWDKSEFRNASNEADAVWPRDAVITPHPSAKPTGVTKTKSKGSKKRRR